VKRVNPHIFNGLGHSCEAPGNFSFSRNIARAKVHVWRILTPGEIAATKNFVSEIFSLAL
jgi:hypothetical protein